ncbi:hypothetical protein Tsp_06426 [Trichinella spiralis]|uniref:hypothetical protein n=1 Tax=Trichinella spiralis TaxID=6334 RepID=UPI0001EFC4C6|nr:hypothetical protein Tsp_06426 [Trichinella spiralis]
MFKAERFRSLFLPQSSLEVDGAAERIQHYSTDANETYSKCRCTEEAIFVQTGSKFDYPKDPKKYCAWIIEELLQLITFKHCVHDGQFCRFENFIAHGFLDFASRIVYQADTLQSNSHYRNVIRARREDSEDGLRLKLLVIETVCSTERALFIGYVYSYNCPNSSAFSSIKCLLTMNNNRTNIVLRCNYLRVERI